MEVMTVMLLVLLVLVMLLVAQEEATNGSIQQPVEPPKVPSPAFL
jgi:hypothetical protein